MTTTEMMALLGELDTPAIVDLGALREGIRDYLSGPGRITEQAARWQQCLQLAGLAEDDAAARAILAQLGQKVGAISRIAADIERLMSDLAAASREAELVAGRLRDASQQAQD